MKKILLLACITASVVSTASAQLGETLKAQLVKDWQRSKEYTQEYLNAMPADKYGFKATDSVRSFAQQMLHLASGTIGLVSGGTGQTRLFPNYNL